MKTVRRLSALLLSLLLLAFAGCRRDEPRPDYPTDGPLAATESAPTDAAPTEPAPYIPSDGGSFTFENLLHEDAVSTLVSAYRSVQMLRYENDVLYSESYYFQRGGENVWTRRSVDPEYGDFYSCGVGDAAYHKEGDRLQFSYYLEEDSDLKEDYSYEYDVCAQMLNGDVQNIESAGEDLWRFEIRDAEISPQITCRCTATKQTLTLKTIDWDYGDGSSSRIELRYGDDAQTKDFGLLDGFDKPTRTVKCVCTLYDQNGKPTTETHTLKAPYNAEPLWIHSQGLSIYMDKDLTEEYTYPGNGVGYTVYATNAMG